MRVFLSLSFAALTCAVGCESPAASDETPDATNPADLPDMEADLPTSPTAVRVALFGDESDAPNLRAWPAWVQLDDNGISGFLLVGTEFSFADRAVDGVGYPAADVEFGAPPADAIIGCAEGEDSADGDPCTSEAVPLVLVTSADQALASQESLTALDDAAPFGISSYLAFREGAMQIETVVEATGEASTFLAMPVVTVGEYRAFDDENGGTMMSAALR